MEKNKILLVDDEEDIRDILGIVLTDMGYQIFSAKDGQDALEMFDRELPPLVLTDIKMPGLDGIELLREIKRRAPDTEVIMITGHGDMELAVKSLKYEATDFITKPINDDILEIAIRRANERILMKKQLKMYTENLERLVEEKTRKLLEAERLAAVGQTAAGLSHAIKNITGALAGGVFVLDKGFELGNKQYIRKGWKIVKKNVKKINNVAVELLNFASERTPNYQHCDPNGPAREIYELIKPQAREYGITFNLSVDENLPYIWLDPEGMHRALLNLVTNAMYACMDIRCTLKEKDIHLRTLRPKGWAVEYQVEDTGCGMDEDVKNKLFRNFFSTKGYDGTGLGLMITKKIIAEHGGTIDVRSEKGVGTMFSVRLPQTRRME
ncbi:sensor histidine kinase [Desulfococcus sp.]|uniref:sensor histidine kinase n=1 Tax=Desulfococcus sp. TaxID=2025834 RepID=UPI0035944AF2